MERTPDEKWNGPSWLACADISVGLLAGASKVDTILILPSRASVRSFVSSEQLRVGRHVSVTLS